MRQFARSFATGGTVRYPLLREIRRRVNGSGPSAWNEIGLIAAGPERASLSHSETVKPTTPYVSDHIERLNDLFGRTDLDDASSDKGVGSFTVRHIRFADRRRPDDHDVS
jgi:hypothetical protein